MSLFPSSQRILHLVQNLAGRVEILSRKESSFFEVIEKTLNEVSETIVRCFVSRKQTLMVEVIEYLKLYTGQSFQLS